MMRCLGHACHLPQRLRQALPLYRYKFKERVRRLVEYSPLPAKKQEFMLVVLAISDIVIR
jgi:hypothetical protein